MTKGLFVMDKKFVDLVYPQHVREEIEQSVDVISPSLSAQEVLDDPSILQDVEVLFSGWSGLQFDEKLIKEAPHLKAIFHAAGSIKPIVSDEFWDRDILITSAYEANAVPVAEYTLSQILFSLKSGWKFVRDVRENKSYPSKPFHHIAGGFDSTVGIISLSTVGKKVIEMLQHFDINILIYDPFLSEEEAASLHIKKCSLDEVFKQADVVSLHAPLLPETIGMITGEHMKLMKDHASFINTARGAIVKEEEMIEVLKKRQDITAIIDVTHPEPPMTESPLYDLKNVIVTPHIAGSEGPECGRMGAYMLEELKRYLKSEPLKWQISKEKFKRMA